VVASGSGGTEGRDYWGRLVDENMIVLRCRIREMKMIEMNHDDLPSNILDGVGETIFFALQRGCLRSIRVVAKLFDQY
jgi:hypothetical protein